MVGLILKESESASVLIDQILTLARADADTEQLSFKTIDLCELVAELEPGALALAQSRGLHWCSEIPSKPILIGGDRPHLRRLLLIFMDNACRYTEKGGNIRVRLGLEAQGALLEVSDTGIGIPPGELSRIFERFFRASNARFFAPDGSGLGLSIANWITHAHGGTLTAKSTVGSGTSLLVRFQTIAAERG